MRTPQTEKNTRKEQRLDFAGSPLLLPFHKDVLLDTDLRQRLVSDNVLQAPQKPRLVSGIQKKLESRCLDYAQDFVLHCYWHDLLLAKKLTALVSMADRHKVAPDMLADDLQQVSGFWAHQQTKLEDVVRRRRMFPNFFFTIAPAEWTFPLQDTGVVDFGEFPCRFEFQGVLWEDRSLQAGSTAYNHGRMATSTPGSPKRSSAIGAERGASFCKREASLSQWSL